MSALSSLWCVHCVCYRWLAQAVPGNVDGGFTAPAAFPTEAYDASTYTAMRVEKITAEIRALEAALTCSNTCPFANNGYCQDGGENSVGSGCDYGTDCADCGSRS